MTSEGDKLRWSGALVAFDYCDTTPLARMIEREPIPVELRPVIASIVSGERKPKPRAAAKSKAKAAERLQIGATIAAVLDTIEDMKHPAITGPYADRQGVEPSDAIKRLNDWIERTYDRVSGSLNVSRETCENLVREFREKMRNWPRV